MTKMVLYGIIKINELVIEFPLDDIPENWLEIVGTVYGDED